MKTIQEQQQQGYEIAKQMDEKLGHLLINVPPEQFPYYWLTITRTIQSTLNIIVEQAKEGLKKQTPRERLEEINLRLQEISGLLLIVNTKQTDSMLITESFQLIQEGSNIVANIEHNPTTPP